MGIASFWGSALLFFKLYPVQRQHWSRKRTGENSTGEPRPLEQTLFMGTSVDTFVGRFVAAFVGSPWRAENSGKINPRGCCSSGGSHGRSHGPTHGQISLSPALSEGRKWGIRSVVVGSALRAPQLFAPNRSETLQNKGLGALDWKSERAKNSRFNDNKSNAAKLHGKQPFFKAKLRLEPSSCQAQAYVCQAEAGEKLS